MTAVAPIHHVVDAAGFDAAPDARESDEADIVLPSLDDVGWNDAAWAESCGVADGKDLPCSTV